MLQPNVQEDGGQAVLLKQRDDLVHGVNVDGRGVSVNGGRGNTVFRIVLLLLPLGEGGDEGRQRLVVRSAYLERPLALTPTLSQRERELT